MSHETPWATSFQGAEPGAGEADGVIPRDAQANLFTGDAG